MGLFKILKKIVSAPRHIEAKIIEKIGDKLAESDKSVIYETGWALQKLGKKIDPKCYQEETSSAKEVIDISFYCKQYYNEAISNINAELDAMINKCNTDIKNIKSEIQLLIPYDIFLRVKNVIPKEPFSEIRENVKNTISEKISISNDEFKNLLGIYSDDERKAKCTEYIAKTMENSLNQASKDCDDTKRSIITDMLSQVHDYFKQIQTDLEKTQKEQKDLLEKQDNADFICSRFTDKTIRLSYLSCILRSTDTM